MKETDYLYSLIKSLTKTEKAYFKKYANRHVIGGQNKYILLFDVIDNLSDGYDEKQIKLKFQNEKFVKNFPVIKKYLMETLLKSLSSLYSMTSPAREIKSEISYIEILYRKALFQSCSKILERSLKQAYKQDNFLLILELLKWKKNLIHEGAFKGNDFINLKNAYDEEQDIIAKIKNLSDYRMLSYRVRSILVGTNPQNNEDDVKKELYEILHDPLLSSKNRALSYPAVITYFHILANLYDYLKKDSEAFESRKELIKVMEDRPEFIKDNLTNYVITVYNILGSCLVLKMYKELEYFIEKLRNLENLYPQKISDNDRLLTFLGSSIFELRMRIGKGEFSVGIRNLVEIKRGFDEFDKKIVKADELYLYYLIAYSYFGSGNFKEALTWINKILNDKDVDRKSRLNIKSKIFNLIVHYELGNFDLLDYLIRSTFRFFEKNSPFSREEKIVIQLFKSLIDSSSTMQSKSFFEEYLRLLKTAPPASQIEGEEADSADQLEIQTHFTNIADFDIESWLESKISGKTFANVVKEKYLQSLSQAARI
jgi:hypothetical protein